MNEYNLRVLSNIIAAVESGGQIYSEDRDWTAYAGARTNSSKEVTCTLGPYQAYGDEAQELVRYIFNKYPEVFASCDPSGSIKAKLSSSWVGTQWNPTPSQKEILIKMLATQAGHEAAEHVFWDRLKKYISRAESNGVRSAEGQMMWSEVQHLGGANAVQRIFERFPKDAKYTCDEWLAALKKDQSDSYYKINGVGSEKYWSRHQKCAEFIRKYADLTETSSEKKEVDTMAYDIQKLLNVAFAEEGYMEKRSNKDLDSKTANAGSNNYTKYGRDMLAAVPEYGDCYGINYQWCDQFVDWCFVRAYGKADARKLLIDWSAYTPTSAGYFKKAGRYDRTPSVGAVIFFHNSERICHTGIVYAFDSQYVYTIEGNTSNGTAVISNGGMVCKKAYLRSNSRIDGYGHPNYGMDAGNGSVATASMAVLTGQKFLNHYYGDVVKASIGHLLDEDNDFGSDTYKACLAVWKDVANRIYGANLTITNHNFGNSCKEAARKMAVSKGCEGTLVWIYETMLSAYGFYTDSMDGAFGNNLDKAVRKFQESAGLEVDGSLGADSVYALFNYKTFS